MEKKIVIAGLIALLWVMPLVAQQDEQVKEDEQELILESLDGLVNDWLVSKLKPNYNRNKLNVYGYGIEEVPQFNDSIYEARLKMIETPVPMDYNDRVKAFIDVYCVRKREQMEIMMGLSHYYFPMFEEVLDRNDIPLEFVYMPVIESALNPNAVSKAGATGSWQFMYSTGKIYGLNVTSYLDERRDPYLATEAAAKFLRDLHNIYGDWLMVIAAYNCGPGNVNKAIRRSGGKTAFWDIYPYLPRETRGYVPAFIAATYAFTYSAEHNLYPRQIAMPLAVDTILVEREIDFNTIAGVLDVPIEMLRELNPQFKKDIVPARSQPYLLRLPIQKCIAFCHMQDSIYSEILAVQEEVLTEEKEEELKKITTYQPSTTGNKTTVYYSVKSGDNLGFIAEWFDVTASDLRRWNGINGNMIRVGQKLKVHVDENHAEKYAKVDHMSFSQKQSREHLYAKQKQTEAGKTINYTVRRGDTLWTIAQRYPGVSADEIKRLNNIRNPSSLKPGQIIKIQERDS